MARAEHDYQLVLDLPIGKVGIGVHGESVSRVDYLAKAIPLKPAATRFARRITREFNDYFANARRRFTLPLELRGTPFQQRVWAALGEIPAGSTLTYGGLAARLGTGARAVGNACRQNPVSIIVPCHRVVSATGMGGYSGKTAGPELARKQWLLEHESAALPLKSV